MTNFLQEYVRKGRLNLWSKFQRGDRHSGERAQTNCSYLSIQQVERSAWAGQVLSLGKGQQPDHQQDKNWNLLLRNEYWWQLCSYDYRCHSDLCGSHYSQLSSPQILGSWCLKKEDGDYKNKIKAIDRVPSKICLVISLTIPDQNSTISLTKWAYAILNLMQYL